MGTDVSNQSLHLGFSSYFGGLDNKDEGGGNDSDADGDITIASADFEYSIDKFDFRGAIAHTNIDGARQLGGAQDIADEKRCLECGDKMKEVERCNENGVFFVWYQCVKSNCEGQWLQKIPLEY